MAAARAPTAPLPHAVAIRLRHEKEQRGPRLAAARRPAGHMWSDLMQRHDQMKFHLQVGGGDQVRPALSRDLGAGTR